MDPLVSVPMPNPTHPAAVADEGPADDGEDVLSEEAVDAGLAEGWLLPIEPLESHDEYEWMVQFAGSADDSRLRPSRCWRGPRGVAVNRRASNPNRARPNSAQFRLVRRSPSRRS